MIIGNGMIANAFAKAHYKRCSNAPIIFASGVSNSVQQQIGPFLREQQLLQQTIRQYGERSPLIYFSSCALYDPSLQDSPYLQHKRNMEQLVQQQANSFYIFRLPQVIGRTQNTTLIHFLYQKIKLQQPFELWRHSYRNLIDIEDVVRCVNQISQDGLFENQIINIASPKMSSVIQIVHWLEQLLQQPAHYESIDKGMFYQIDITKIIPIFQKLNLKFADDYALRSLEKYYPY